MKQKTKRSLIVTSIVIGSILLIYLIIALFPRIDNFKGENPMRKDGELPILIAHGGGNREFPDNTLEAFYNAYSVDNRVMMETDVSITKDGVVLLSHDTTIDRKTNATGNIIDWNYSDLISQEIDFGYTNPTDDNDRLSGERKKFKGPDGLEKTPLDVEYPEGVSPRHESVFLATTLEDLLVCFPNNKINVEIKQSGETGLKCFEAVLVLLEKYNAYDRVVLASFHDELYQTYLSYIKEDKVPDSFMCSPGTDGVTKYVILRLLGLDVFFGDKMCVFQLPTEEEASGITFDLSTKALIRNAHRHNLAVHYWTINDKDEMRELIEMGADGIMTDYPHRLKEVYESYNK
ncbi:MAG: hypothetical protein J6A95_05535 [Clostridia bacterium]|nr:hypothetical protein [Clostridia bacterium]